MSGKYTLNCREHMLPTMQEKTALTRLQPLCRIQKTSHRYLRQYINHKKDRQIGYLDFHPKLELPSERPGYLQDWALVERDLNTFNGKRICLCYGPVNHSKAYTRLQGRTNSSLTNHILVTVPCQWYEEARRWSIHSPQVSRDNWATNYLLRR